MINKIETFGKDHWSLFAYIETRCVDHKGVLNKVHLRIKNPAVQPPAPTPLGWPKWNSDCGTRLLGYFKEDGLKDKTKQLPDHDDLDCIEDLEEASLIENRGTGLNPASAMTKYGKRVASQLREHKANGGQFASFNP